VDFTHIRWAPVLNCIVRRGSEILLIQRSDEVGFYPGVWNGVSGFLDDTQSLEEKVRGELAEELGFTDDVVLSVTLGPIFDQEAPEIGKTWIVHPVLVEVSAEAEPKLDWEARNFAWVKPADVGSFELLPGFEMVVEALLQLAPSASAVEFPFLRHTPTEDASQSPLPHHRCPVS